MAQWVLGPDTGAVFADAGSFLALSDTRSCGKLIVLARLLESWRGTRDKVGRSASMFLSLP